MGFIYFVHILAAILLVITILMQAGRGGGLAESFSSAESMFGTQANTFMVRCSTILAVIFFTTSLTLAISSAKGHKSLMEHAKLPAQSASMPEEPTVKVSDPKPMVDAVKEMAKPATKGAVKETVKKEVPTVKQAVSTVTTNTAQ
ncbi:MAG: preprotein translocase subunit SecG [Candidatus Omnitrophica bacterium]|nr:preprotein translocase subunit SecG [Candidatus Omnitrophota bacterium]